MRYVPRGIVVAVVGLVLLTAASGGLALQAVPDGSPAASPAASPVASPVGVAEVRVSIVDYGFEEERIEVAAGTTVTWINDGLVIHTTTATDGRWDSAIMSNGDAFSHTFTEPGTYEYRCALHPRMVGTVVVSGP